MNERLQILVCPDGAILVEHAPGEWKRESMPPTDRSDPHSPYREYRQMFDGGLYQADGDSR